MKHLAISAIVILFLMVNNHTFGQSYFPTIYVGFTSIPSATSANANLTAKTLTANGNLGHWESGVYGNINDFNSQWAGIGSSPLPNGGVYGLRAQWKKDLAIFNLRGGSGNTSPRDLAILWGTNTNNRLKFEFVGDPATQQVTTEVMTMLSSGRVGINTNTPAGQLDIRNTNGLALYTTSTNGYGGYLTGGFIGAYGRSFTGGGGFSRYGVVGGATGGSSFNAGVYGFASGGNQSWAGYFAGNLFVSGSIVNISDRSLKINVIKEEGAVQKLLRLNPVTYNFDTNKDNNLFLPTDQLQHGLIAQEVQSTIPELVKPVSVPILDSKGDITEEFNNYVSIDYNGLISILIKAVQEQQEQIKELSSSSGSIKQGIIEQQNIKIEELLKRIEELEKKSDDNEGVTDNIKLYQNSPNPFDLESEIKFELPQNVVQASIFVYNMQGTQIKRFDIATRGLSKITIAGSELEAGMYIYSLIADGKEVDSKRMILSR